MGREQEVYQEYCHRPVPGVVAAMILGRRQGVQFSAKNMKVNIYTDGTVCNPEFTYWSTDDTLRHIEAADKSLFKAVRFALDRFESGEEAPEPSDGYKAAVVRKHLEAMAEDSCHLVRLTGTGCSTIDIGQTELELLLAYYKGKEKEGAS